MNQEKRYSDEFLNAFVDNQLAPEEKGQAYLEIANDETVNRQVCELRKLHDLVQFAYRDVPPPAPTDNSGSRPGSRLGVGIAAALLLAVGVAVGLQVRIPPAAVTLTGAQSATRDSTIADNPAASRRRGEAPAHKPAAIHVSAKTVTADAAVHPTLALPAAPESARHVGSDPEDVVLSSYRPARAPVRAGEVVNKVLVHIAHNDPNGLVQALHDIEGLMHYYQDSHQDARVEVVLNGRGLDLVRRDTTQFGEQIAKLQKEYDNLTFAACQNTIDRVKREQGVTIRLLPGVIVIDSGMAEIMRRQIQGWTYLQV